MIAHRKAPRTRGRMQAVAIMMLGAAASCVAGLAMAQSLPPGLVGAWDVSADACAASGTSVSRIDVAPRRIATFGGNALLREVERIGDATFAAGNFRQLEGAAEVGPRTREHFRFDQDGPDRMRFRWKDVQTVDLVRCPPAGDDAGVAASPGSDASASGKLRYDGQLPIPLGFWVVAGESCQDPANAGWRVYDGAGLRGGASVRCEIDATERDGDGIVFSQLCEARYGGEVRAVRDRIIVTAPRRFTLREDGEEGAQDFNWCGPRLRP